MSLGAEYHLAVDGCVEAGLCLGVFEPATEFEPGRCTNPRLLLARTRRCRIRMPNAWSRLVHISTSLSLVGPLKGDVR